MSLSKIHVPVTPEIALAVEAGLRDAIKDVLGKEELRDKVSPNQTLKGIKVEMTLEIGEVTFGHDTDRAPTASIPLLPTLALLLKRMGFQRDSAMEIIREVMTEALTFDEKAGKTILAESGVAEVMEQLKTDVISKLPRVKVAKAIKARDAKLTITGVTQTA